MKFIFRALVKASVWSFLAPDADQVPEGASSCGGDREGWAGKKVA
jgi:hypothetical protein